MGELVVCKISRVNPNSAFAVLDEYDKCEGMIHISEISSGWVNDIRKFVKVGDGMIAKVMNVDESGHVGLSIKRVDAKQKNDKMREFNQNNRAEKMLEMAAKNMKKTLTQAYNEVGYKLQENFPSLYDAFKKAMENPKLLAERGIPEKWVDVLKGVAEKNIELKEFEFKAMLTLKTNKPDGIKGIKNLLSKAKEMGLSINYIAAPNYMVKYKTMQAKKGEKEFTDKLNKITSIDKSIDAKYEMI
jgi:translation initiation factor 2 subunit 1